MTYLLVKGVNGFGNMISALSVAFNLALISKRTLVIDWTHPEWKLGFDLYFSFKAEIKYMKYKDFLEIIENKKITIYPKLFKGNLDKSLIELQPGINLEPNSYSKLFDSVQLCVNNKKIDVIVFSYNYCGYAKLNLLFNNLIIKESIDKLIKERITILNSYKAIHIRQTDIKNVSLKWAQDYIQNNLDENIYIATDNKVLLEIYKKMHPKIFNFTTFFSNNNPLHTQELSDKDKNIVNVDTIIDLILLANSKELKITPQTTIPWMSTYSALAVILYRQIHYSLVSN